MFLTNVCKCSEAYFSQFISVTPVGHVQRPTQGTVPNRPAGRRVSARNSARHTGTRNTDERPSTMGVISGGGVQGNPAVTTGRTPVAQAGSEQGQGADSSAAPVPAAPVPAESEINSCCGHRLDDDICQACGRCCRSKAKIILAMVAFVIVIAGGISEVIVLLVTRFRR